MNSKNSPLVSIIIPVYNGSNYLKEAIDSALNQTYTNVEILVVDDGSTDETWNIIQSYGDKIKSYHKQNSGVSTALNLAIANMNGEWFTWLSHDDLWRNDKLEKQVEYAYIHPNIMMFYSGYEYINHKGLTISKNNGIWYPHGEDIRHMLYDYDYINGITVFINRVCFDNVGIFNENMRCVQDYDMWIRIMEVYDNLLLPLPLAKTRVHESQTGNIMKSHCKNERREMINNYINKYSLSINYLYPELDDKNILYLKKLFLKLKSNLFLKRLYIRVKYNLPKLNQLIFIVASKILPNKLKQLWYNHKIKMLN